jgi:4-aminobutyrate aminotransferase-like enzyme
VQEKYSRGNYFKDADGNVVLDLDNPQPLGYNHDRLIFARDSLKYDRFLQGPRDLTNCPPSDFTDILREGVMPVAPSGT